MEDQGRNYNLHKDNPYVGRRARLRMARRERLKRFLVKTAMGIILLTASSVALSEAIKQAADDNITELKNLNDSYYEEDYDNLNDVALGELEAAYGDNQKDENNVNEVPEEKTEEQILIQKYCDIFEVRYDVVYPIIARLTNDFTDPSYLSDYAIDGSTMKGYYIQCGSKEEAILIRVRAISQVPERYGTTLEEVASNKEYQSDMDYAHQVGYFSTVLEVDPCISYAICMAETGFTKGVAASKNNPSGIRFGDDFASFPNITVGIIEQICESKKHAVNDRVTPEDIKPYHAPDGDGEVNNYWLDNVNYYYEYATEHYEELFDLPTVSYTTSTFSI